MTNPLEMLRTNTGATRLLQALADVMCWLGGTVIVAAARYDFMLTEVQWGLAFVYACAAGVLQLGIGWAVKLYRGRAVPGSYIEAEWLTGVVAIIALALAMIFSEATHAMPRGLALLVPAAALTMMLASRFLARWCRARSLTRAKGQLAEPVIIYGAGNAGCQLARLITEDADAPYRVAGFIDDDPAKRYLHLGGSWVVGTRADIVEAARSRGVQSVVLAITTADATFVKELECALDAEGLRLLVLPPVQDIVNGRVQLDQLREVDLEDLLGRRPITSDLSTIADYLSGKVVLVTGAGGSIGSEIARQVHSFGPKELVCLDRDESALHAVQLSIYHQGLLDSRDMVLCDIRDRVALDAVFAEHKPEVVFHAAALKHLPMLEQYPAEGWKTNVIGTLNVLDSAARHGVQRLVNISTDKAADPTSVLGSTKRNAERLTSWFGHEESGSYVSVRFGNVLGSRGSVVHTFRSQIASGGPVTVVHPDVTRFFMTIPEACQLVIQAGAIGESGDVMVLDMGEPVRILDVAERMVRSSGRSVPIKITGLRTGEKLHEVTFAEHEAPTPMSHPLISRVHVPAASLAVVLGESPFPAETLIGRSL